MTIIDLTQEIHPLMPVYPGTEPPIIIDANTYIKDGFAEKLITMYSHTGTHIDVPRHIFPDGLSLSDTKIDRFIGTGLVIDARNCSAGKRLTMDALNAVGELADRADFLLFNWGWDKYWGTTDYCGEYPCISDEIAEYAIKSRKKGLGLDTIGIDPISDEQFTLHHKLLRENVLIIENLTNLSQIGAGLFTFAALPLKIKDGDGAPVRAVAVLDR